MPELTTAPPSPEAAPPTEVAGVPLACGPGWSHIVTDLHRTLLGIDPGYRPIQIKEKFGGLRYYIDRSPNLDAEAQASMDAAIRAAEEQADHTCEICGGPGVSRTRRGWLATLCDEHATTR